MTTRFRYLLIGVALLGAAATVTDYRRWSLQQTRLRAFLERADASRTMPGLADRVRRANDPAEAAIRATRPLVALYVDPTWLFDISDDERLDAWERSLAALGEINQIAADLLRASPTSWEAAMIYGAATYLSARGGNMAMSSSHMEEWEVPLRLAESLIPGYAEPTRYLALAYVNYWQGLSSQQRRAATATMTEAFRDQRTFDLTVELWLRYQPDRRRALETIPDDPHAWKRLENIFRRRREWDLYLHSQRRFQSAEERRIDALLDEAEARTAGGDYRRGTSQFHAAVAALEPDGRNLARLERVLDRMPPGPVNRGAARSLRRWLEWSLDLGFVRQPPLRPENLRRLAGGVANLSLPERALSSLMAGDLPGAEQSERRWQGTFGQEWDRYLILKAEALLRRGERQEAQLTLQRLGGSWDHHPTYLRVAIDVARALADPALPDLQAGLDHLAATTWRGHQMSWAEGTARLELVPSTPTSAISIEFLDAAEAGLPIDILWNGRSTGRHIVLPGESLVIEAEIEAEVSLLEIRGLDQRPFSPGLISLITSES